MIIELQSTREIEEVFDGARWYEEGTAVAILDDDNDHTVVWDFWSQSDRLLVEVSKSLSEYQTACKLLGLDENKVRRIYSYYTNGNLHYICLEGDYKL